MATDPHATTDLPQAQPGSTPNRHSRSVPPTDTLQEAKTAASRIIDKAQGTAGEIMQSAGDSATALARSQQDAGADMARAFSQAVTAAAEKLDNDAPGAAGYVRDLAGGLERISNDLKGKDLGELAKTVGDFARRQPLAFFAGTALAGFMLSRFLKSNPEAPPRESLVGNDPGSHGSSSHGSSAADRSSGLPNAARHDFAGDLEAELGDGSSADLDRPLSQPRSLL